MRSRSYVIAIPLLFIAVLIVSPARADIGIQAGPRTGIELDGQHLSVGGDVRFTFPLSPLTLNLSFDYYFIEDQTLFQIGFNPLYYLPLATRHLSPYVGAGMGVTRFAFPETSMGSDSNGVRVGLNLIGGVRFDLPVARPFAQAMVSLGEIDLYTIGIGVLFGAES